MTALESADQVDNENTPSNATRAPTNANVLSQSPKHVAPEQDITYPTFSATLVIMMGLYLGTFLAALDRTIIGTAIPAISNEFNALQDIGWYGSAYLLTSCSTQLIFGRIYTFYNPKYVYLTAIAIFEVGSALCGAAPNSTAFIFGRAIAGLGSAGMQNGGIIIITQILPLHKRPAWQGGIGAVFGIASILGPLLGGAFTTNVTWRWCFYINLPIGAVIMVVVFFVVKLPNANKKMVPFKEQLQRLDPLGTLFFVPGIVSLLLALQWGGSRYAFSNSRIVILLTMCPTLLICFAIVQRYKQDTATLPPRILNQRSILASSCFAFTIGATMITLVYYIPIYFQAIRGASAVDSGIRNLPLVLGLVVLSMFAGFTVQKTGQYAPFMIASSIVTSIATGCITFFKPDTPHPMWIGLQVMAGAGIGMGMQQPMLAVQAVLPKSDAPTGLSLLFLMLTLGGAIFVSVGENVLTNFLLDGLRSVPGVRPEVVVEAGATTLRDLVPAGSLAAVVEAYNSALVKVFYVAVGTACATILGSATIEWKSTKSGKKAQEVADAKQKMETAEGDEKV